MYDDYQRRTQCSPSCVEGANARNDVCLIKMANRCRRTWPHMDERAGVHLLCSVGSGHASGPTLEAYAQRRQSRSSSTPTQGTDVIPRATANSTYASSLAENPEEIRAYRRQWRTHHLNESPRHESVLHLVDSYVFRQPNHHQQSCGIRRTQGGPQGIPHPTVDSDRSIRGLGSSSWGQLKRYAEPRMARLCLPKRED
jgi:hypothetical protein